MDPALWIGPAIVAAVIAGLINVAGWFVTSRQTLRLERVRRAERVIDTQTALLAEIRSDLQNFLGLNVDDEIAAIERKLKAAPPAEPYVPFVPRDSGSAVFTAIVPTISVLPTEVIDAVVLYYKQREAIAHFTEDLRSDRFLALPNERKLAMMEDYLRLRGYAGALAADAISALQLSLGLPQSLNNRVADRSVRQSASAAVAASSQASSASNPR